MNAEQTWTHIEHLLTEECGLRPDEGLTGQRENCINAIRNGTPDFRWLIEAPGQRYLAVQRLRMSDNFEWTSDHNEALAFRSKEQADALMMAIRQIDRRLNSHDGIPSGLSLFGFETSLGNAKPVEHGWL